MKRSRIMMLAITASIVIHIVLFYGFGRQLSKLLDSPSQISHRKRPMKVVRVQRKPPEPEEEAKQDTDNGQIVELAKPEEEIEPVDADYLAEKSHRVEKETASNNYSINPEVISPEYAEESQVQYEDAIDVDATENSTGAQVGNQRRNPNENGKLFSNPSPFAKTNKKGVNKPTLASSTIQSLSGAPSNDLLNEEQSNRTELNAHAYKYATYMNQIRRLVNFFWQQEIDNLQEQLVQDQYYTVVAVEITDKGILKSIEVTTSSNSAGVDRCVTRAFQNAGPFPEPPVLLVENGSVRLPDFGFTLNVTGGQMQYGGIDPRAGVRFPGILKAPY